MSTIAAIATAVGNGGIGIIRMSGKECFNILNKIFKMKSEVKMEEIAGYTIKYGYIINAKTGEEIDEVLVSFFRTPKSYTTENMCEINSHGGMLVEQQILEQCLENGAELAEPGEFTKRAFLNGRIDLSQAEGVIDLINSKTEREAKASLNQLDGGLSKKIGNIKAKLLDIMADIEASIDYPEYDIEEITNEKAIKILTEIKKELEELENSFNNGKLLKEGVKTAIIGKPNAGKSSILNAILKEERAIVSNIEGTTRDTIEEFVTINGVALKLIDTAGIREAKDEIEEIGVKKTMKKIEEADLIIAIFDCNKKIDEADEKLLEKIKNKKVIILLNKVDIKQKMIEEEKLRKINKKIIKSSAKTGEGLEELYKEIENMFKTNEIELQDENIITNIRHQNQIKKALESILKAIKSFELKLPIDIISVHIIQTLDDLSEITGDNVSEDIINEIFSKFCLGK